jgi:hypothetical protein
MFSGGAPKAPPAPPPPPTIDTAAQQADAQMKQFRRRGYAATVLSNQATLGSPNLGTTKLLGGSGATPNG